MNAVDAVNIANALNVAKTGSRLLRESVQTHGIHDGRTSHHQR